MDKAHIAANIVRNIRCLNPPGRFLKEDQKGGPWYDIGDEKAIKKVCQALREAAPELRQNLQKIEDSEAKDAKAVPAMTPSGDTKNNSPEELDMPPPKRQQPKTQEQNDPVSRNPKMKESVAPRNQPRSLNGPTQNTPPICKNITAAPESASQPHEVYNPDTDETPLPIASANAIPTYMQQQFTSATVSGGPPVPQPCLLVPVASAQTIMSNGQQFLVIPQQLHHQMAMQHSMVPLPHQQQHSAVLPQPQQHMMMQQHHQIHMPILPPQQHQQQPQQVVFPQQRVQQTFVTNSNGQMNVDYKMQPPQAVSSNPNNNSTSDNKHKLMKKLARSRNQNAYSNTAQEVIRQNDDENRRTEPSNCELDAFGGKFHAVDGSEISGVSDVSSVKDISLISGLSSLTAGTACGGARALPPNFSSHLHQQQNQCGGVVPPNYEESRHINSTQDYHVQQSNIYNDRQDQHEFQNAIVEQEHGNHRFNKCSDDGSVMSLDVMSQISGDMASKMSLNSTLMQS